jgi:hypothetical protein
MRGDANRLLGVHFRDEDEFSSDDENQQNKPSYNVKKRVAIKIKDRLGKDHTDVFRKFDVENIEMLPNTIVDYRIDFRYFLIAAGSNQGNGRAIYTENCFIDDIIPPLRKHFTVDQYFKRMKRFYEDDDDFSEYEISINELKQVYLAYKMKQEHAGGMLEEFYDMLGFKEGFKSFWGLAICHTSSHNRELHEVLRRALFKMSFKSGDCIINTPAPVPKGKTDKYGKPLRP